MLCFAVYWVIVDLCLYYFWWFVCFRLILFNYLWLVLIMFAYGLLVLIMFDYLKLVLCCVCVCCWLVLIIRYCWLLITVGYCYLLSLLLVLLIIFDYWRLCLIMFNYFCVLSCSLFLIMFGYVWLFLIFDYA